MSIEAAARDILRASQSIAPAEPPEWPWKCEHCKESNPESFEICWQCGLAATKGGSHENAASIEPSR
jgi:hypothetical protein